MKILFILEHYYPNLGGAEVLFKHLAEGLVKKGHKVKVITSRLKGTIDKETLNGVMIERIKTPMWGAIPRHWFTFLSIPKCIREAKDYDIIQTTTFNAAFPARIAALIRKKPSVIITHELLGSIWNQIGCGRIESRIKQIGELMITHLRFTKYVCVSKYTRDCARILGVPLERLEIINSAVDYERFKKTEDLKPRLGLEDKFVCLYYGRPGILKGLDYLALAIPLMIGKIPQVHFLMILAKDEPKMYHKYYKMIEPYLDHITLLDPVPYKDLPNYMGAADCTIVPSISEGFCLTVVESNAVGNMVVATNAGAIPEVISGKYRLVNPARPEEIAEAVYEVSKGNHEEVPLKRFEWAKVIDRYERLYAQIRC